VQQQTGAATGDTVDVHTGLGSAAALRPDTPAPTPQDERRMRASRHADARAFRYARNQLLSRRTNERIATLRYCSAFDEYICECGLKTCVAAISLTAEEFWRICAQPGRFAVSPGHASRKYERVVDENARFHLVERLDSGDAG
jgi:hypothetical protein